MGCDWRDCGGKQAIIVGDPRQLPPTNFFGRSNDGDGDDLAEYEKDMPSILDEVSATAIPAPPPAPASPAISSNRAAALAPLRWRQDAA